MAVSQTLAGQILAGAGDHDATGIVFDSVTSPVDTTLGALVADAERAAGALRGLGVEPGDVVAVQLPGTYEGAVAQAAVALAGAVLLPIVMIYGRRELDFILRQSRAKVLVTAGVWRGRDHAAVAAGLPGRGGPRVIVVAGEGPVPDGMTPFADLLGRRALPYRAPELDPSARAMLVYTSGTTADPKGVQHTHRSLLAETSSQVMLRSAEPGKRHLSLFPPGHVGGLLGLLRVLVHGSPTAVMDSWDPARAAGLVDRHGLTVAVGAPVQLAGLLDVQERGVASLATLREFLTGAASVPPALIRRADAAGIAAYRSYGSSEHPTVSSGVVDEPLEQRATTDGLVIEGNEVRLVDDDGKDVPDGALGEIVSRGAELFAGYSDERLNREAFLPGGWYRSGDLGRLSADGHLTVVDRKKDVIIRGGENISSQEVEAILAEHPAVTEVAAFAVADHRLGERVGVAVVLRPGGLLALDDVRAHFAAAGAARQKTPEHLVVVEELPRTSSGKVRKHVLRAAHQAPPA
jgi:acyl-CoA synthetase (AMP-forming)/AMP-acid ligase II